LIATPEYLLVISREIIIPRLQATGHPIRLCTPQTGKELRHEKYLERSLPLRFAADAFRSMEMRRGRRNPVRVRPTESSLFSGRGIGAVICHCSKERGSQPLRQGMVKNHCYFTRLYLNPSVCTSDISHHGALVRSAAHILRCLPLLGLSSRWLTYTRGHGFPYQTQSLLFYVQFKVTRRCCICRNVHVTKRSSRNPAPAGNDKSDHHDSS